MTEQDPGDAGDGASHEDWLKRREALAERLAAQRARLGPASGKASPAAGGGMKGAADGMKLASEFIGGILAGAGLGYLLDRIAGTKPFGLIVLLLVGFVAGIFNVLRVAGKPTNPAGGPPEGKAEEKQSAE